MKAGFVQIKMGLLCTALLVGLVLEAGAVTPEVITVGGTGTAIGVMKQLGALYEKKHPEVHIEVLPSLGTTGAVKAVLAGAIGLGVTGRALNEEERQAGALEVELARTPFIFVTPGKTGKERLASRELEDLFSGKTTLWPSGERVRLILRPAREASTLILKAMSPRMAEAVDLALAREGMIFAATDQEAAEAVLKTPGGLATSTLTQVVTEQLPLTVLALNGVTPSPKALAAGTYNLFKPLFIVTTRKTTAAAKRFADFLRSREAQPLLEQAGNWTGPFPSP
ncbi:MAG: solute-binding protein [Desulfobulbaceae bacterium]|nr:solute-binding protein [Desulfobulbaceae bacterium]